jgi:hypothetical protein
MKTFTLTGSIEEAEVLTATAHRLIRYGCTEREAHTLARVVTLDSDATDQTVEAAVIGALVAAKEAVHGLSEVEYLGGLRRDTLRLEGR